MNAEVYFPCWNPYFYLTFCFTFLQYSWGEVWGGQISFLFFTVCMGNPYIMKNMWMSCMLVTGLLTVVNIYLFIQFQFILKPCPPFLNVVWRSHVSLWHDTCIKHSNNHNVYKYLFIITMVLHVTCHWFFFISTPWPPCMCFVQVGECW